MREVKNRVQRMVKKERENEKNPHYQPQIIKTKTLKIETFSLSSTTL